MKACPMCGLDLEDAYLFCPEDGSPLQPPDAPAKELPEYLTGVTHNDGPDASPPGHVVLYCPACAAEYPLTFSECPVHGVALTKHRVATFVKPRAAIAQRAQGPPASEIRTPINREAQSAASHPGVIAGGHLESMPAEVEPVQEPLHIREQVEDETSSYHRAPTLVEAAGPEPKSFRVAAITIVVALAVLSLAGLYALYSNVRRKPVTQSARSVNKSQASAPESEFIPTPQAALDYKEEPPAPPKPEAPAGNETEYDKEPARAAAAAPSGLAARAAEERRPPATISQPPVAPQTPVAVRRPASGTDLVLPRGTYGLIDARLIRMRGRQTPSGYRYDLTFNLQEQAGRVTQYDRLAVVTRSASGVNHSEVMPFSHRLGASGDLTFTISVELKGRSQSDWQGRIICTSIGTDNQGRPLRTSFGANVSP